MAGRWITPEKRGGRALSAGKSDESSWTERLAKYVPAEILTGYLFLLPIVNAQTKDETKQRTAWLAVILFGLAVIGILYLAKAPGSSKWPHIIVGTIAYLILTYSIGGFWTDIGLYSELTATVLIVLFALIAKVVVPTDGS